MTRIAYTHGPGGLSLLVDGVEIGWACAAGFTIGVPAPDAPVEVAVRLLADDFTIDGDGTLTTQLPDGVHAALVASGWTPPGDTATHGLRVEVHHGQGTPWVRLLSRNGETLMHSENYASRSNARRAARALAKKIGADVREVTA